jgi:hypothetical protein
VGGEPSEDGEDQRPEYAGADLQRYPMEGAELGHDFLPLGLQLGFDANESLVHLIEALLDVDPGVVEALVHVASEIVETLVGPAIPHRLHDDTLDDNTLRRVKKQPQKCDETQAQDETRTRDPFLTMEVLYQLSYLGEEDNSSGAGMRVGSNGRLGERSRGGP